MMHEALFRLLRLRWRGALRRMVQGVKTVRGAILFALGIGLVALFVLPSFIVSLRGVPTPLEQVEAIVPLAILGACLVSLMTSSGERAIYFSPGEVDFLFAGPFTRREVLAYKLLGTLFNVVFGSVFFCVFMLRFTSSWLAAYLGVFLALVFVQYVTIAAVLVQQLMAEHAYTRLRKVVVYGIGALAAIGIGESLVLRNTTRFGDAVLMLHDSAWLRYVLIPIEPFARAIAAPAIFPDLLLWGGVGLAINAALFVLIVRLDAEYRETAVRVSERIYARLQHARQSGMAPVNLSSARRRVPRLPWLGGAGPIAWRQLTNAMRNTRSLVMLFVLMGIAFGVPAASRSGDAPALWRTALTMVFWLTILSTMMIRFDFRSDIGQMDLLKSLPVRPLHMAMGQLVTPVLMCTALQACLIAAVAFMTGEARYVFYAIAFGPPVNLLLFGCENTLFLLAPLRAHAVSPGDFQVFGRQLLMIIAKLAVLGVAVFVAVGVATAVSAVLGRSALVTGAAVWITLTGLSLLALPCVAWAYRRFDVSLHMPA